MRLLRDRDRQDKAVVVVGVLAEQVDAARRVADRVRRATEYGFERLHCRDTSTCCSSRALSSGSASIA